jgi:hypothetical protein
MIMLARYIGMKEATFSLGAWCIVMKEGSIALEGRRMVMEGRSIPLLRRRMTMEVGSFALRRRRMGVKRRSSSLKRWRKGVKRWSFSLNERGVVLPGGGRRGGRSFRREDRGGRRMGGRSMGWREARKCFDPQRWSKVRREREASLKDLMVEDAARGAAR